MTVPHAKVASPTNHADMANAIRFLAADAVEKAKSGHPGMPMGMADVATVLFSRFLKFDAKTPRWSDRDRFVLSAGHGSMLLYALAYLTGYDDVDVEQLKQFRQLGARTAGHPEYGHVAIAETTTGPLGQGIANAVGFALAEKIGEARFGADIVDHYTYVIAGDGCLMEGISQEAISLAGHHKLSKLIVLWDDNEICIDGRTSLALSDDQLARFSASQWDVARVDGHDPEAIARAIEHARTTDKPSLIACRTVIGYGAPTKAGSEKTHGAPLGAEEIAGARVKLGWASEPFVVPGPVLESWRNAGVRGASARQSWEGRLAKLDPARRAEWDRLAERRLPAGWREAAQAFKAKVIAEKPKWATRKASQEALEVLTAAIPELTGGSADLTGSNLTKTKATLPITPSDASGSYIHYGVREHGMAAVMNGLALHDGLIPYGATFLVFTDYLRPALRMSALMGLRVLYVMTHDSIGLGEDGPTHQPVEHLASLRAIPNLLVFRPCDPVETMECYEAALDNRTGPSLLSLCRQNLPTVRLDASENKSAKGAYVLAEAEGTRKVTLIATGSEVELALKARDLLKAKGVGAAVVSMPCWELFDQQDPSYRKSVLGEGTVRIAVEAASTFGWERYVGPEGAVVGLTSFGLSAPAEQVYQHFGITAEAVADAALGKL
ncbi:transketolase [Telmatospirillum siberiense]|uniref:Transketolase n=1 Tax=Telmatospirillum siberiense TaxID=382514 RepID=A0A2N3PNF2_9PROT|nr:transketolase [Telmatospirillum siberiense]PKU21933.1 transketolase [Telmatospirillum siberiense]